MNTLRTLLAISALATSSLFVGCGGSDEPTVIDPGEGYQMTDTEAANREREKKALEEQRQ